MPTLKLKKGRFSSSKIHALMTNGRKAGTIGARGLTYISEKDREFKLQRSLSTSVYSRPIYWGYVMEKFCFAELGIRYQPNSQNYPTEHKDYPNVWCGIHDANFKLGIAEIKSYQLDGFSKYADCLKKHDVEVFKKEFPQEYWQIVSGAILEDVEFGEAIAFMPYKDDLENYRTIITDTDFCDEHGFEPWQIRFIVESDINDLPWIESGKGLYENITKFRFEVPQADKEALTERVEMAREMLFKYQYLKTDE